jgi:hypothetical protein
MSSSGEVSGRGHQLAARRAMSASVSIAGILLRAANRRCHNRTHAPQNKRKQKDRLAAVSAKPTRCFDQAAAVAALFLRFLRLARKPIAPRPEANSGSAAGMGVALTSGVLSVAI